MGVSGVNLTVDVLLDAIAMGGSGPGALVLHPRQVGDVTMDLLAMAGKTPADGEKVATMREVLALDIAAARGAGAGFVGRVFGCDVWAWTGCRLVNRGADRMGLYVGERVVGVVSDA